MRLTPGCPVIASEKSGTPKDTLVLLGKRNKQAKDRQLSRAAIVWSKAQFMTRSVQRTICHCERKIGDPAGYFCTRGEKEYASIRQAIVACDSRLVKREAYDASPGRDTLL